MKQKVTLISSASWEISAFFPQRCCRVASNSLSLPILACRVRITCTHHFALEWMITFSWKNKPLLVLDVISWRHTIFKAYILFFLVTQSKEHLNNILNNIFGLTSHLGDSGMKNNPTTWNRDGIISGQNQFYSIKIFTFGLCSCSEGPRKKVTN